MREIQYTSEEPKPKGVTNVIIKLDNGKEVEWQAFYDGKSWYDKSGCYIPNVIKWELNQPEQKH